MSWFFVTPVIYSADLVLGNQSLPAWVGTVFFANPMTALLTWYRHAFLGDPLPAVALWPGFFGVFVVFSSGRCSFTASNPASPMNCSRPLKRAHLRRWAHPGSLRRTARTPHSPGFRPACTWTLLSGLLAGAGLSRDGGAE